MCLWRHVGRAREIAPMARCASAFACWFGVSARRARGGVSGDAHSIPWRKSAMEPRTCRSRRASRPRPGLPSRPLVRWVTRENNTTQHASLAGFPDRLLLAPRPRETCAPDARRTSRDGGFGRARVGSARRVCDARRSRSSNNFLTRVGGTTEWIDRPSASPDSSRLAGCGSAGVDASRVNLESLATQNSIGFRPERLGVPQLASIATRARGTLEAAPLERRRRSARCLRREARWRPPRRRVSRPRPPRAEVDIARRVPTR